MSVSILAFWALTIPLTRIILGVHSLDQTIYGTVLGIYYGLVSHFLVRDKLIAHISLMTKQERKFLKENKQFMKLLSRESIASNNQRDASINNQESYEDVPTFNSDNEVKKNTG